MFDCKSCGNEILRSYPNGKLKLLARDEFGRKYRMLNEDVKILAKEIE